VKDIAAIAPGGRDLRGEVGLLGKEKHRAHLCTIANRRRGCFHRCLKR
jgi:hypothetical protein